MSTRLAALNEGRRGARGQQAPQLFKGRVRKWEKKWISIDPPRGSSKVKLMKWVSEEPPQSQRSQSEQGDSIRSEDSRPRYPHLRPVLDGDSQLDNETKSKLLALTAEARELERGRRLAPRRSTRSQGADLETDELSALEGGRKRPRVESATEISAQQPLQLDETEPKNGDVKAVSTMEEAKTTAEHQVKASEMSTESKAMEVEAHTVSVEGEGKADEVGVDNIDVERKTEKKTTSENSAPGSNLNQVEESTMEDANEDTCVADDVPSMNLVQGNDSATEEVKDLEEIVEPEKVTAEGETQNLVPRVGPEIRQQQSRELTEADSKREKPLVTTSETNSEVEMSENEQPKTSTFDLVENKNKPEEDVVDGHCDKPNEKESIQEQNRANEIEGEQGDIEPCDQKGVQDGEIDTAEGAENVQHKEANPEQGATELVGVEDAKSLPSECHLNLELDDSNVDPDSTNDNASPDGAATADTNEKDRKDNSTIIHKDDVDKEATDMRNQSGESRKVLASEEKPATQGISEDAPPRIGSQEMPTANT